MDIEQLYRDYNIDFATEGDHRHARPGWVNTPCPFCVGNPGYHLGYDKNGDKFVCWRCGGKTKTYAVAGVLKVDYSEAKRILRQYGALMGRQDKPKKKSGTKDFALPTDLGDLRSKQIRYLESRDFDVDYLIKEFKIQGAGPHSLLIREDEKPLPYKNRIFIPFYWYGEIVTFDARAITEDSFNKYQACPIEMEIRGRKDILYGLQEKWKDTIIIVEGPTDVWRMGPNSAATSGIKYTPKQLRLIAKNFKRVPVLFDDESQAVEQADKLVGDLKFRGVDSFRVDIKGDPGGLSQEESNYLVKQLI
jgi:hypothetical protein